MFSYKKPEEKGIKSEAIKTIQKFWKTPVFPHITLLLQEVTTQFAKTTGHHSTWLSNNTLYLNVQVIDDYFGRLHMYFRFTDENTVTVQMKKTAENFLNEYTGMAVGYTK